MVGRDAPWVGGEPPYEEHVLDAWDHAIDAGIGDLIAAPLTLLDTVAHPAGIEPVYLAAVVTRLLVRGAAGGSPSLGHARRWLADIDVIAERSRARGRPPRFREPAGDWAPDERALAFALLMARAVECAAGRPGEQA